ncbi:hypothetical protein LTR35_018043 [Friedmanniomyces endolithicus]|nr:hypothetical protein LTR35_018043 [Friedmanniomyces endolithicus]KAK0266835.1 hypothetical protein LTS00_017919 [Friedmanniomyces endolithicus]KAK0822925.1 hypothetical protein LTR73_008927 [Friedmanniomyces endolithicus]KAK0969544.1 hypothetical protein LTR54_018090 [Friedmanniomyces endolithicus]
MNVFETEILAERSGQLRTIAEGSSRNVPEGVGSVREPVEDRRQSLQLEKKWRRDSKEGGTGKSGAEKQTRKEQQDQEALRKRTSKKKKEQRKKEQRKKEQRKKEQRKKEQQKKEKPQPATLPATSRVSDLASGVKQSTKYSIGP